MMRLYQIMIVASASAAGCGGTTITGEPLISGSVAGSYDGSAYAIKYGVAAPRKTGFVILLGSEPINCDSLTAADPPSGDSAAISMPALDVNHYGNVGVELLHNIGSFTGTGSNSGSVEITSSNSASVAGTVSYSDTISTKMYSLSGTFEVLRCP
ncbi:MAG: hypothetical protein JWO36_6034 [Myxococcales bacterium]|nr:hypothetical protein [Myxococcales bacterium]